MEPKPDARTPQPRRRRPSLYRTVLSVAIAAIVAASIPFAALYGQALQPRPAAAITAVSGSGGTQTRIVTTASGRVVTQTVPATGAGSASAGTATPIVTRTSVATPDN